MMMSPVTKGLLARNRKGGALLPPGPGKYQPKVPNMCLQDPSPLQNKLPMLIDEKLNSTWGIQWNFVLHDNQGIQLEDDEVS